MLKIGEFSKLMKISTRMLRYYDENGLLSPAKVNEQTGYRMYGNKEVERLNKIQYLRELGFSVEETKDLLMTEDESIITQRFYEKEREIEEQIERQKKRLAALRSAQQAYKKGNMTMNEKVILKEVPNYWVLSLRRTVPNYYCEAELWQEMQQLVTKQKLTAYVEELSFSIYHDNEYKEQDVDIEICGVIKEPVKTKGDLVCREVVGCKEMATLMVYGPFSNIAPSYLGFVKWLEENDAYEIIDCDRQITHRGPWNEADEDQYLVELQIPVAKR